MRAGTAAVLRHVNTERAGWKTLLILTWGDGCPTDLSFPQMAWRMHLSAWWTDWIHAAFDFCHRTFQTIRWASRAIGWFHLSPTVFSCGSWSDFDHSLFKAYTLKTHTVSESLHKKLLLENPVKPWNEFVHMSRVQGRREPDHEAEKRDRWREEDQWVLFSTLIEVQRLYIHEFGSYWVVSKFSGYIITNLFENNFYPLMGTFAQVTRVEGHGRNQGDAQGDKTWHFDKCLSQRNIHQRVTRLKGFSPLFKKSNPTWPVCLYQCQMSLFMTYIYGSHDTRLSSRDVSFCSRYP